MFAKMFLILDWPCFIAAIFTLHTASYWWSYYLPVCVIISSWPACKSAALCRNLVLPSRWHAEIWASASCLNILVPLFCLLQTCDCCVDQETHSFHNNFPRFSSLIIWNMCLLNFLLLHLRTWKVEGREWDRREKSMCRHLLCGLYFHIWFYSPSWII